MRCCQIFYSHFKPSRPVNLARRPSVKHCLLSVPPACLAPLGCLLACLLLDRQFNFSSINGYEEFEISLILFFSWNCLVLWYSYQTRISVLFSYIAWRAYIYHAITCHLPDITLLSCYSLTSDTIYLTLIIITITEMMIWHLAYILIYFNINHTPDTPVLLILLTCSCSFLKSDNSLINHKKITYTGSEKTCGYQYMFVFTVILGMLCN